MSYGIQFRVFFWSTLFFICEMQPFVYCILDFHSIDCLPMSYYQVEFNGGNRKSKSLQCLEKRNYEIIITPTTEITRIVPLKRRCNVREFALFQLRLPENGVHIVEAMVDPAFLLDMVQVDETT